jgi:hypothetical protein
VRRRLAWLLVSLGIAALVRRLRRHKDAPEPSSTAAPSVDPADELRRKLAETRPAGAAPEAAPEGAVAERRAEVHDEGRAALEEMRSRDAEQ